MSDRDLSAGLATAVQAAVLRPVLFYEGEFAASTLNLWTGLGSFSWDGKTWTGGGNLMQISPIEESSRVEALGFSVTLSGMPSASISLALQSLRQGKPGRLWLGALDADNALVGDPYQAKEGKLDIAVIDDNGESCTIQATYESRMIDLFRPRERRYTDQDQQIDYPGDDGFGLVPAIQDRQILWGGPGAAASPVASVAANPAYGPDGIPGRFG